MVFEEVSTRAIIRLRNTESLIFFFIGLRNIDFFIGFTTLVLQHLGFTYVQHFFIGLRNIDSPAERMPLTPPRGGGGD